MSEAEYTPGSQNPMFNTVLMQLQNPDLSDDERVKLSQQVRQMMLFENLKGGVPMGKDTYRMLKLLEDIDNTSMATKKLESDNNNAAADRQAQQLIAELHSQLGGVNPFQATGETQRVRDVTPDRGAIPSRSLNPDEDAVGIANLTYTDFVKDNEHLMVPDFDEEEDEG